MDAAGRFKRPGRLMRNDDLKRMGVESAKMVDYLFCKVRHIYGHLGDAGSLQGEQVMLDQCFAPKRNQWFWRDIGQGRKTLAPPGGQNHC